MSKTNLAVLILTAVALVVITASASSVPVWAVVGVWAVWVVALVLNVYGAWKKVDGDD